jgi:hypothetical protein
VAQRLRCCCAQPLPVHDQPVYAQVNLRTFETEWERRSAGKLWLFQAVTLLRLQAKCVCASPVLLMSASC